MNAQEFRCPALIAVGAFQHSLDEPFFEFTDGLIKEDAAFHHLSHKPFQLVSHIRTLRSKIFLTGQAYESSSRPTSMRYASRYLARVAATTSGGRAGPGGVLGHWIRSR